MNDFDRDILKWILRAILAARGPMPETGLKLSIRGAFPNVAFTDGDLVGHIKTAEEKNLIAGTNDDVAGVVWDLTPKGKIKAQQSR
ncbi:MAG TPA: hypothetical protein VHG89_03825 [Verrucomicrobiae bacterium]|nr:hypothetical protein [Verrucomicrobiae bacterium]